MNQLAMISESGESTASRSAAPNGFTSKVDARNPSEDSLFQKLKTSELLKHLLNTRTEKKSDVKLGESRCKNKSQLPVSQPEKRTVYRAKDESINKIPKVLPPTCSSRAEPVLSGAKVCNNGIMDKTYSESSELSEVQSYRDHLQRFLSDESSQSQNDGLSEEDLPVLSNDMLSTETMDFILSEAEKNLHIQSPPSSQVSQDSDSYEFTELLPISKLPSYFESSFHLQSTSKDEAFVSAGFNPTGVEDSVRSKSTDSINSNQNNEAAAGRDTDSDSDVDNAMVLVPSGKSLLKVLKQMPLLIEMLIKYFLQQVNLHYTCTNIPFYMTFK